MASGEYGATGPVVQKPAVGGQNPPEPIFGMPVQQSAEDTAVAQRLVNAFGGASNVRAAEHVAVTRLRFVLRDPHRVDQEALERAGINGVMQASENVWHVVAGQHATAISAALDLDLNASATKPDQV
jgi:PTS system N-acetylglucosamine-specific IIC component